CMTFPRQGNTDHDALPREDSAFARSWPKRESTSMSKLVCRAILVLTTMNFPNVSWAQVSSSDEGRLKEIVSIIKQRHDQYDPIRIRYRLQTSRTKFKFATISRLHPDDKKSWALLKDGEYTWTCEFARKGVMQFQWSEGPSLDNFGRVVKPKDSGTYAYDGKL